MKIMEDQLIKITGTVKYLLFLYFNIDILADVINNHPMMKDHLTKIQGLI